MVEASLTGMHPRSEKLIKLRSAYRWGKAVEGKIPSQADVEEAHNRDAAELITRQRNMGLQYPIDGLLRWNSIIELAAHNLSGVEIPPTNLRRWFNTNTFYHKPIVKSELRFTEKRPHVFHADLLGKEWKAVLPGPYTFSRLVEDAHYCNPDALMAAYAEALKLLIQELEQQGCSYVQLDEPSLVFRPMMKPLSSDELSTVRESWRTAASGRAVHVNLHTYFEDASPLLLQLLDFPADSLGIDFQETGTAALKEYSFTKPLACGIVDARNSLVETVRDLRRRVEWLMDELNVSSSMVRICPNTGLRYLPRRIADRKLENLGKACRELEAEER
ncbi:MAG: hypothetical protein ACE5PO_02260 [Candidatus Bathyarchaeia archaeon]